MDYAQFAGVIPKGEYGAGTVSIWDSGEFDCEKWRDGKEVIATLTGKPGGGLQRHPAFRADPHRRVAVAMADPLDERPARKTPRTPVTKAGPSPSKTIPPDKKPTPQRIPDYAPMLATSGTAADVARRGWLFELKWDGFRAIITGTGGEIRLTSRSVTTSRPPTPSSRTAGCWPDGNFVADGEIVALGKGAGPTSGCLQLRMNLFKTGDIERARAAVPVQLMLFDLLYDAGRQPTSPA